MNNLAKIKPHYTGHRLRLKERLLKTELGYISDEELLEIILFNIFPRIDVKPIAKDLIKQFGSIAKLVSTHPSNLKIETKLTISGISILRAIHEIALRMAKAECLEKPIIESWISLINYCRISIGRNKTEEIHILYLNKANMLINDEIYKNGSIDHINFDIRKIIKQILLFDASAIILVHNHPTGITKPSKSDIITTKELQKSLLTINVSLHDHIIISANEHFSFRTEGLI